MGRLWPRDSRRPDGSMPALAGRHATHSHRTLDIGRHALRYTWSFPPQGCPDPGQWRFCRNPPRLDGEVEENSTLFSGYVSDTDGTRINCATIDFWQNGLDGHYSTQKDILRGCFPTDHEGRYLIRCLRPTAYRIPDGPVRKILSSLDRTFLQPAHLHVEVSAPGHRSMITQLFDMEDENLGKDPVFAVREELLVKFVPMTDGKGWRTDYDFVLERSS